LKNGGEVLGGAGQAVVNGKAVREVKNLESEPKQSKTNDPKLPEKNIEAEYYKDEVIKTNAILRSVVNKNLELSQELKKSQKREEESRKREALMAKELQEMKDVLAGCTLTPSKKRNGE
jgi:uncharacterized protein YhaN